VIYSKMVLQVADAARGYEEESAKKFEQDRSLTSKSAEIDYFSKLEEYDASNYLAYELRQ
ncbi:hypothetical protein Tco_0940909, partial [Tanacetum coccineum]